MLFNDYKGKTTSRCVSNVTFHCAYELDLVLGNKSRNNVL